MIVVVGIGIAIAFIVGVFTGIRVAGTVEREWAVRIEPTRDPAVYRGVYIDNGSVKYDVEGIGITDALRNLADEVDKP